MHKFSNLKNTVLLLGESENMVSVDKQMLRGNGLQRVLFCSQGAKLARFLGKLPAWQLPKLLVCCGFEDMNPLTFLSLIRLHPNMVRLPVLLVQSEFSMQTLLDTSRLGYVKFLARPYTQEELEKAVSDVNYVKPREKFAGDIRMFNNMLESLTPVPPALVVYKTEDGKAEITSLNRFDLGNKLLKNKLYQPALDIFTELLNEDGSKKGEVLQGLSEANEGLGFELKSRMFLKLAAEAYLEEQDFYNARLLFSRLYQTSESKPKDNPLYNEGMKLLAQGYYKESAQAFLQGQTLTPKESFYSYVSKACDGSPNPGHTAEMICSYVGMRSPSLGKQLRKYLLVDEFEAVEAENETKFGFLGFLGEVISVATYTARLHMQG